MSAALFRWRGALVAPVALLVLWLARPTGLSLALGLLLTGVGEGIRLWALGYTGRPTRSQSLVAPRLVTGGPYSLVRNPLYLGNLLNAAGAAVGAIGGMEGAASAGLLVAVAGWLGVVYGGCIRSEERFLAERFGPAYAAYRAEVPALWPRRLRPRVGEGRFCRASLRFEVSSLIWLVAVWWTLGWRAAGLL